MHQLRREPFRILFPLALLIGGAGMLPWLLFGRGLTRVWPGPFHSVTMTQAFLVAVAAGFLGTMVPRRSGGEPRSWLELALLGVGTAAIPWLAWENRLLQAQLVFAGVLLVLAQFVVRRMLARRSPRPAPPSFVLIPLGLLCGLGGAALAIRFLHWRNPLWAFDLGRGLAQQGLMLCLVMALVPMLTPIFLTGEPPPDASPRKRLWMKAAYLLLGLAVIASFFVEHRRSVQQGLYLRALAVTLAITVGSGIWASATRRGLHRVLYRLALIALPASLFAAGMNPLRRIPLLHLGFVAGLSLLVFAVSVHVTLLHTGREREAEQNRWPVALVGLITVAAAIVRIYAESFPRRYFESLTLASGLWLAGLLLWAAYLVPKLIRNPAK